MSRYIDADKLEARITASPSFQNMGQDGFFLREIVLQILDGQPTADVVEVVRCKDCVNYCGFEHCKNGICDKDVVSKRAVYPNDYCSYGERREENEG